MQTRPDGPSGPGPDQLWSPSRKLQSTPGEMALEMRRARPKLAPMGSNSYSDIKDSLRSLYMDSRPWLVGFSGGKDSTMLASLIVEVVAGIPNDQRKKPVALLCTETWSWREISTSVSRTRDCWTSKAWNRARLRLQWSNQPYERKRNIDTRRQN